ncbi:DUF2946 family protein [Poseidonocella sp. HB161398]|uniref:DUF2946 family protein n=1 Tax=Poseidonocella sp. HB161398 TaxID=2320855 RepID=UPI0011081596|nr:DUF2946 family protein [Poseidonocella sp. HB161398]
MIRLRTPALAGFLFAALLVALSVLSAAQMGPDRDRLERQALMSATGAAMEELCGTAEGHGHGGHDSHDHGRGCPFCHKLPGVDRLTAPDRVILLSLPYRPSGLPDLVSGPQHLLPHVSVRAPPRAA